MSDFEVQLEVETTDLLVVETDPAYELVVNIDVPDLIDLAIETTEVLSVDVDVDTSISLTYEIDGETHSHLPGSKVLNYTEGRLSSVVSSTRTLNLAYNVQDQLETVTAVGEWVKSLAYTDGVLSSVNVTLL